METMLVITCSFNPVYESLRIEAKFEGTLSLELDVNFDDRILLLIPFVVVTVCTLSPEEERLWSIVRANSLEFNAWTALIEETERIAQVLIFHSH